MIDGLEHNCSRVSNKQDMFPIIPIKERKEELSSCDRYKKRQENSPKSISISLASSDISIMLVKRSRQL